MLFAALFSLAVSVPVAYIACIQESDTASAKFGKFDEIMNGLC